MLDGRVLPEQGGNRLDQHPVHAGPTEPHSLGLADADKATHAFRRAVEQFACGAGGHGAGFRHYNSRKNAIATAAPATLALMRQYALDYGAAGIRSNAVNADRIRSGLLTGDMVKTRARARGLSQDDYMSGNLLGTEVTAADVARAFVDLALASKTTAAVITVDGGNIAAALR
ncbi:MAG: SDR family oxidoreductase [Proteobacteria bacterium]|nr:SDR family oxidoreductase [Pseudomonadota bacterium]